LIVFGGLVLLPERASRVLLRLVALVTLLTWAYSTFLYGQYGQLDGSQLRIDVWTWLAALQLVVLGLATFLLARVEIRIARSLIYLVFVVGAVATGMASLQVGEKLGKNSEPGFHSGMTELSPTRNVIHVVLDSLRSDVFLAAIQRDPTLNEHFDGFTVFRGASSVYPSTELSLPMLITGEIYRNERPKKQFRDALRTRDFGIKQLRGLGFALDAYTLCDGIIRACTQIRSDVMSDVPRLSDLLYLLDIQLFKSVPDLLKPWVYDRGNWFLLSRIRVVDAYAAMLPGLGHLVFTRFVDELSVSDDPSPRYKLFHSMVTHRPMILDAHCNPVPRDQLGTVDEVTFAGCGIRHVSRLLEKLKVLGVYDTSMIVLSSDHGAGFRDGELRDEFRARGIDDGVLGLASAMLAVKPYDSRGKLGISDAQASLRDIPLVILDANGIHGSGGVNQPRFPAWNFLDGDPTFSRTREFLQYKWSHDDWRNPWLPAITIYEISGDIMDSSSWAVVEDPLEAAGARPSEGNRAPSE
jgi:hypothetical protein